MSGIRHLAKLDYDSAQSHAYFQTPAAPPRAV
jgi:hypothetical protein